MPVPNSMADLFTIAGSNFPQGTEAIGNSLDNYIRAQAAILRSTNALASATIAAASTTDIATADAESVQVTGAATITSLGSGFNGCRREVRFSGACVLTNSANIALPNSTNITTVAGDVFIFRCIGSGQWIMVGASRPYSASAFMQGVLSSVDATAVRTALGAQASLGYTPVNKAGDDVSGQIRTLVGTAFTFQSVATYGWAGNSRWTFAVRDDGDLSMFAVDSGGVIIADAMRLEHDGTYATFAGSVTSSGGRILTDSAFMVLGRKVSGSCTIILRPNGENSSTGEAVLATNGNLTISGEGTGVNWFATSDMRLKDVRGVVEPRDFRGLEILEWIWKDGTGSGIGPGAQHVEAIAQQYVSEVDGVKRLDKSGLALEWCASLERKIAAMESR